MIYELIVFDWDGTLFDSAANIVSSLQEAARDINIPVPTANAVREVIGLSLDEAVKQLLSHLSEDDQATLKQTFRSHLVSRRFGIPTLFSGAYDVLQHLNARGYQLAIATGKNREGLNNDLTTLKLHHHFKTTRCSDESMSKPHPKMLFEIMDELAVESSKVLMIGDSVFDLQFAANANVDALAVSYGVRDESSLMKYSIKGCLSNISDLPSWLLV